MKPRSRYTLYYQCRSCSCYLSGSSKWVQHLNKCLLNIRTAASSNSKNGEGGHLDQLRISSNHPGFRLTTFTEPRIVLSRLSLRCSQWSHTNTKNAPRPQQATRQSFIDAKKKIHSICSSILWTEGYAPDESKFTQPVPVTARKEKITCRVQKPDQPQKTKADTLRRKKLKRAENADKPTPMGIRLKAISDDPLTHERSVIRKNNCSCPLCPGKFFNKRYRDVHVKSVHNGNRKVMDCCVCGRVFNKRDSLNSHILAHEAAEAREEKFNLLQPWTAKLFENVKTNSYWSQQNCKFCLLLHPTYYSFINHMREEHPEPPEGHTFSCKFDNCSEKCNSIKELLNHGKSIHPKGYYGKITWLRISSGVFTGKQSRGKAGQRSNSLKPKIKKRPIDVVTKPVKSFIAFQKPLYNAESEEEDCGSDWERECKNSDRHTFKMKKETEHSSPLVEVKIEVDKVDFCDTVFNLENSFITNSAHVKEEIDEKPQMNYDYKLYPDIDLKDEI